MSLEALKGQQLTEPAAKAVDAISRWLTEVVMVPREGARGSELCPWATRAFERSLIHYAISESTSNLNDVIDDISFLSRELEALMGGHPGDEVYCATGTLYLTSSPSMYTLLDRAVEEMKIQLLEKGLLVGRFHSMRTRTSRRFPSIYTMRTPYPMVMLRRLVRQDIRLLDNPELRDDQRRLRLRKFEEWMNGT